MEPLDVLALLAALAVLATISIFTICSQAKYLRKLAHGKDGTERARLLRDFFRHGGGGSGGF